MSALHRLPFPDLADGPVVQQVDRLLHRAVELGASDVHVEPYERALRVRYRLDGVLHLAGHLDPRQAGAVASRLKVLAALDIAEKRRPQDGRIALQHDGRPIDLRVSVLPTHFGEKVVLRVLDKSALRLDLAHLGFEADDLRRFREAVALPYGVVLVTGPTGSGKTTTLYAALSELDHEHVNVTTVEDPIEYDLPGVNQTRARPDLDFGFAEALRAFLRQDPDVIMVGEIRDAETAQIAVRAALTGHLVLSTLHTNDAPSAVARLADMGTEPYLLAASVRLVMAQRLLRRLCPACREPLRPGTPAYEQAARVLGVDSGGQAHQAVGCDACGGTGYRGRTAVFEVMPVAEAMAGRIAKGADALTLRRMAQEAGMRPLREAALALWRRGDTTAEEVVRATAL